MSEESKYTAEAIAGPMIDRIRDLEAQLAAMKKELAEKLNELSNLCVAHAETRKELERLENRAKEAKALVENERARFTVADDALAAAYDDVLTVVRGGERDLRRTAALIDVARQSVVLANWTAERLAKNSG